MNLRYIQSAAIILWGIQSDLIWFALPMAIVWEAQFFLNRRWALTKKDFYQIADLTSVALIGILLFLFINRTEYHFLTTLVRWFPILFFPLVTVLSYSTTERMTLDVMFYSLRKQQQPVTQSWDMNYMLFATCIVAAGTNTSGLNFYFPLASILVCLSLLPLRSSRYQRSIWLLAVAIAFLGAFGTHKALRGTHLELQHRAQAWIQNWIQRRSNPLKIHTAIGALGRLKVSDEILFRVRAPEGSAVPRLLQEASYDLPTSHDVWTVMETDFERVDHTDDFLWDLSSSQETTSPLEIFLEFKHERALVPLPSGTTQVDDLPALDIKKNYYGSTQAVGLVPSPKYNVRFSTTSNLNGPPMATDRFVQEKYKNLMGRLIEEHGLNPDEPMRSLFSFFKAFRYSLYHEPDDIGDPITHFLLKSKKGHCEYYASTTVFLLRQMDIPARYVVGYAVQEYNDLIDMYIVRQRHAHAWAIAYIDGQWQVVDTTPAIWAAEEAKQANVLQPFFDFFTNINFVFQVWWNDQRLEDYEIHLYVIGFILVLVLAWRILHSEQVIIEKENDESQAEDQIVNGSESPFFELEELLQEAGYRRGPGELLSPWLSRIGFPQLIAMLKIHNQWRFDPNGISEDQKNRLIEDVKEQITEITSELGLDEQHLTPG